MIFKMKECNFDLEKYIDTVSGTGGDALLNQSNDINLSLNLGEKEQDIQAEVAKIIENFHIEGQSDVGMIGPEEFFNVVMALYD